MTRATMVTRANACPEFDGMMIFSETKARLRDKLGETVTSWMNKNRHLSVVDRIITQSSDSEFHCVTITLFYVIVPSAS